MGRSVAVHSPAGSALLWTIVIFTALLLSVVGLATASHRLGLHIPLLEDNPTGVNVNCATDTLTVSVFNWPANSSVEVVKQPNGPTTEGTPVKGFATFPLGTIGGNGSYTVGRQGHPHDPTPLDFTVACSANPTPTPHPTPHATPHPTVHPVMPNGGANWG